MLVFTSVIVLGIFFTIFIITDIKAYKQRKVDDMLGLAQVIGTNSISTLQFQDNEAAKNILSELHNVAPEIVHAAIIDKQGRIFASYAKPGADSFSIPPIVNNKKFSFTDQRLFVSNDIANANEIIGKIILEIDLLELQQLKNSKYRTATILLLLAFIFSFLLAIFIQSYITKRLLSLVKTMKDTTETGDYSISISDNNKDEISALIRVFNGLMRQVNDNQKKKDEFISIASHELKTPLTSIKGYLQLLDAIEDKQPNRSYVVKALNNVNKLEQLIRDLLDVSKIQSGQLELNMKEFDMDQLLDETISAIQMVSGTHKIVWENNFNNNVTILADRQRIEQVLTNLLSNAIKYSPGERKVMVYSKKTETELIIKIRDFGLGIPKEERLNIFERFYRTKDLSMTITGFGLGLYICRDIVSRHNGKIWMEAEEKGSAFYFSLPLKNLQAMQQTEYLHQPSL